MSLLVGVCGRTGSGKTTAAKLIRETLQGDLSVGVVSMDDFYRELNEEEHQQALRNERDFDCLESFDLGALSSAIMNAQKGEPIRFNKYNHATHKHHPTAEEIGPFDVVVFEGLYLFADPQIAKLFGFRIFMEVAPDESLIRRLRRDTQHRRRTVEGVLQQYERYVQPAYTRLVAPSKKHAHIILPGGAYNKPGMSSVYSYIRAKG